MSDRLDKQGNLESSSDAPSTSPTAGNLSDGEWLVALFEYLLEEVIENVNYVADIEGYEIPQVWRDRIVEPIAFKLAQMELHQEQELAVGDKAVSQDELARMPKEAELKLKGERHG